MLRINWSVVDKITLRSTDDVAYADIKAALNAANIPCRRTGSDYPTAPVDFQVRLMDRERAKDVIACYEVA